MSFKELRFQNKILYNTQNRINRMVPLFTEKHNISIQT